jgi:hypothetical protein
MLELRVCRTAVMDEWRRVAGVHFPVIEPLLHPTGELAKWYPSTMGLLRVVHHQDGTIVAVHEDDWQKRKNLTHADIVFYQLDLSLLRKVIVDTLGGMEISRTPIENMCRILQIGNWEPKKAASFPVYLLLCPLRTDLEREVFTLIANGAKGGILLTPTRVTWDERINILARNNKLLLVPVCEVLDVPNGNFVETPAWEEYLQSFCQMVKLSLPSNYRNNKPPPMRGSRLANIERLQSELSAHLLSAKDHAMSRIDRDLEPELLPRPNQTKLGLRVGLEPSDVSRCLHDPRAAMLRILWNAADSLEEVLRYKPRR